MDDGVAHIAGQVRAAMESADLAAFAALLDPHVTWGAPGDPAPPCQTREQVLEWYRQGQAEGRRAQVLDVRSHRDKIVVAMRVTTPGMRGQHADADRWQVLTVKAGRVIDIRGYDRHGDALTAAGIPQ